MTGTDLAAPREDLGALAEAPIIDRVNAQQLALIRSTVAQGAKDEEVAMFLELCARYGLDPFAKEAWCAKGRGRDGGEGRLLIMVGRDGLRKVADRNGLRMDGDVVRERDTFKVRRDPKTRERTIEHAYEEARAEDAARREGETTPEASSRGPIVGAWCEVWDAQGRQRGYFYAPVAEYRPTNESKLKYSPWGSQESVMILAAAERQALRQSTPLSGLLAEGEMALNDERAEGPALIEAEAPLDDDVERIIARAAELGHAGLADRATAEMTLRGQPDHVSTAWVEAANAELDELERRRLAEATAAPPEGGDDPRAAALALLDEADAAEGAGDPERAAALRSEAEALHDVAGAGGELDGADQTGLGV